ncbi:MAG: DHCW motif cupin fold protein, partial [Gemmatimonadaceae bacterium]|nr:DHCW motif cupin fold protein [Chitinophagaceae bacterium]
MNIPPFPFSVTDWNKIAPEEHRGETGLASWKVQHFGAIRVRMVTYSPGYFADHWCVKGHIILCLSGSMTTELEDGRKFELTEGMTYQVGDDSEAHRSM